ncbi:MAG: glycoside hydrolase family 31 [Actinobacteria bacterium]|nr:glycoside hydrolase family 31 [Actinomycetota bacterium]
MSHTPRGRGHAYRPSLDQRVPPEPAEGDAIRVGALTDPDVGDVTLELDVDGARRTIRADPEPLVRSGGDEVGGGHLAAAAAAGEDVGDRCAWSADLGSHPAGTRLRYRMTASGGTATEWFDCTVAGWRPDAGTVELSGDAERFLGDVEWLVADRGPVRARFSLRLDPDEHVVGLGERFHGLDQRGWTVDTTVFEQYKDQHVRTYLPVPFALVVGGPQPWGFHVDTSRRCWFDVGATRHDRITVEVACDPDEAPTVRLQLFVGGRPADVLSTFWDTIGRPATAPEWVFRPWISGNEWNTQARIQLEVERSLEEGIPLGVLVIEAWSDEGTFTIFRDAVYEPHDDGSPHRLGDFTFPPEGAWPDPAGLVTWLHDRGVKVLLWQVPLLPDNAGSPQLDIDRRVMVESDMAVREADGSAYRNRGWWFPGALLPDFTSPETLDWWTSKRRYLIEDVGIDGFKTDGGEHAWGDELRYADGTRGDVTNNLYPNLYAAAYHQLMDDCGIEGTTFSRAGWAGAGRTPCHWAGDEASTWDAYRASLTAGLSAGISGVVLWGWDHGGFSGEIPDAELYLRTAAQACFSPIMQYHSEYNHHRTPSRDRTPWNIGERTRDDRVVPIYRRFAVLRDRLVDELAAQTRKGIEGGLPLMRALCLEWPDDPKVWDYPHQYLLGDDLLVSPVTQQGADRWEIYVPGDGWVDPWTGTEVTGPSSIDVASPLERIPVLVRRRAADRLLPLFAHLPE